MPFGLLGGKIRHFSRKKPTFWHFFFVFNVFFVFYPMQNAKIIVYLQSKTNHH